VSRKPNAFLTWLSSLFGTGPAEYTCTDCKRQFADPMVLILDGKAQPLCPHCGAHQPQADIT
jgi:DNA-directed RNA polymerase subunit RPC12/RpoP